MNRNDKQTIHLLYSIAEEIFGDALKEEGLTLTAGDIYDIHERCTKAKRYMLEDIQDPSSRERTLDCLNHILLKPMNVKTSHRHQHRQIVSMSLQQNIGSALKITTKTIGPLTGKTSIMVQTITTIYPTTRLLIDMGIRGY